jgi:signal transduction histidine kinase
MDIRTLIFSLGLLNLTLGLVVFVYRTTRSNNSPELRLWQNAKLVCGVGYVLGWARPLLPTELAPWAHVGNLMQVAGMAMELAAYCRFLGVTVWLRPLVSSTVVAMGAFVLFIVIPDSRHPMIVYGTLLGSVLYFAMAWLTYHKRNFSPRLLLIMAGMNLMLVVVLFTKVLVGVGGFTMVPYANNLLNVVVYAVGLTVMCVNGFSFLMLVQQRADAALQQALMQLGESEQAERELLRTAAHEFRTPAAIVKASVDSLAIIDKGLPLEVVRRHNNIRQAVQRMTDLADTLITRDRLTDRAMAPQKRPTDLCKLALDALQLYPADVRLTWSANVPVVRADVDPTLLRIALQNLIDNALANAPPGSEIRVELKADKSGCLLQVTDLGPGVPDDLKPHLFNRRYSASGSLSKGVGLSIVKAVAESHGGSLSVADNMPTGCVFTLILPV